MLPRNHLLNMEIRYPTSLSHLSILVYSPLPDFHQRPFSFIPVINIFQLQFFLGPLNPSLVISSIEKNKNQKFAPIYIT